jgi:hypothetical protein
VVNYTNLGTILKNDKLYIGALKIRR